MNKHSEQGFSGSSPAAQTGAVLIIAMVFMLMMSMIAVSVMRSGQMEVLMASNEQARSTAFELSEGLAQSLLSRWQTTLDTGNLVCGAYNNAVVDPDCDVDLSGDLSTVLDSYLLPGNADVIAPITEGNFAFLTRYIGEGSPLRGMGTQTSASAFYFDIEVGYDNTANRQGMSELVEGAVVVNPVASGAAQDPDGSLDQYAHNF